MGDRVPADARRGNAAQELTAAARLRRAAGGGHSHGGGVMRSMTGFGFGQAPLRAGSLSSEVRSLNHRFLELRVRLPPEIADQAFFVEQLCRKRLTRGRYDVSVRLEGAALPPVQLNFERARSTYEALGRLRDELAPGSELPLSLLASFPALISSAADGDPQPVREALMRSLDVALQGLDQMRAAEGAVLSAELGARVATLREIVATISEQAPRLVEEHQVRLQQRLERLLGGGASIDPTRLAMEAAVLAERSDITEELVRLGSHLDQFEGLLRDGGPAGRKLDFLLQEVGRETNTIGAKCQDGNLSNLVVSLKAEVERLREQVQNVE